MATKKVNRLVGLVALPIFLQLFFTEAYGQHQNEMQIELARQGVNFFHADDGLTAIVTFSSSDKLRKWRGHTFDLTQLSQIKNLTALEMSLTESQSKQIAFTADLVDLQRLEIKFAFALPHEFIEDIADHCPNLEELSIRLGEYSGCQQAFGQLSKLSNLKKISLFGWGVNSEFVDVLNTISSLQYVDVPAVDLDNKSAIRLRSDLGLKSLVLNKSLDELESVRKIILEKYPNISFEPDTDKTLDE